MLAQSWGQQSVASAAITGEDLLRYPEDGSKYEVFEGILVQEAMTSGAHGAVCQRLGGELYVYERANGFIHAVLQNTLFDFTPSGATGKTILAPDLAILRPGVLPAKTVTKDIPLIVVEVVSPSQMLAEIRIKTHFYRSVGIDEVWVIDPNTQVIEVWHVQGQTTLSPTQTLTSVLLPGFAVAAAYLLT